MKNINKTSLTIAVGIVVIWVLSIIIFTYTIKSDWLTKGSIGDSFGAINSLFSVITLLAVIYTILVQLNEIKENKKDNAINQFENKFFQLLRIHNDIIDDVSRYHVGYASRQLSKHGRSEFENLYKEYFSKYETIRRGKMPSEETVNIAYNIFYKDAQQYIGHYFRNLYNIIAFVEIEVS